MKASERREEILRMATANGLASVEELGRHFDVTPSTIRRDLARLAETGQLARTYGGVIAVGTHREPPLLERTHEAHGAKRAIGKWAASQVASGDTVLLDAGTSTTEVAKRLRDRGPLTVVTLGLTPLHELADAPKVDLVLLGGAYREVSQSFVGPVTETALEGMTFDAAFLGADAVTADRGICEARLEQTRLKTLLGRSAERTFVVAHAAKLGARPFNAWARLEAGWVVVTDDSATAEQLAPFEAAGIEVAVINRLGERV